MFSLSKMASLCSEDVRRLFLVIMVTVLEVLWVSENALSTSLTNLADQHHAERVQLQFSTSFGDNWTSDDPMVGWQSRTCKSVRGDWAAAYQVSTMRVRCNSYEGNYYRQGVPTTRQTQLLPPQASKTFRRLRGSATLAKGNQTGSTQDRVALVALKKTLIANVDGALVLPTWNSTANPDVCLGWEGIRCNGLGRVIVLDLSSVYLGGKIGWALGNLTSLEILDLSNCHLTGQIPRSLANLSSLLELNLEHNSLEGPFPEEVLSITSLETLSLGGYYLSSGIPSAIGVLTKLQLLDLRNTGLNGTFPSMVFGLPNLRSLDLSENRFTGGFILSGVKNLAKLEVLHLRRMNWDMSFNWTFPEDVLNLPSLRSLDLSFNSFTGGISSGWWVSKDLESLNLANNYFNGTIPEAVLSFRKLRSLDLSFNSFSGIVPDGLPMLQLEELYMNDNQLNGTFPKVVAGSINLQSVDLSGNHFEGGLPEGMLNLLNLRSLDLHGNNFTDLIPDALFNLSNLSYLDLSRNSFSGAVPSGAVSTQLESLDLSSNFLNGTFPLAVLSTSQLVHLDLRNNSFNGGIQLALPGLNRLEYLDLGSNLFNGQFPEGIVKLTNLRHVQLDNNNFSGKIPSEWRLLRRMQTLDLSNNRFNGTLPDLSSLKSLDNVFLQDNHFIGTIPASLYNRTTLVNLDLSQNYLTGRISSEIGHLRHLQVLNLSSNNFIGDIPTELGNCSHMGVFDLSHNKLIGRISVDFDKWNHRGWPPFTFLKLAGNKFDGDVPSSLVNCTDLLLLDLSHNLLTGMSRFLNLSSLRVLQLSSNKLSGIIPSWIWCLPQLQILDLSGNSLDGHIRHDLIVWNGMNSFSNDTTPDDSFGTSRDTIIGSSGSLEYTIEIIYKDNYAKFDYLLPTMGSIDLSKNRLSGSIPKRLIDFQSLHGLNLSHNKFINFPNDSQVVVLESLDVSFNEISGSIPSFLGELDSLGVLKLGGNNFSGQIPRNGRLSNINNSVFWPGNPYLCGLPWTSGCPSEESPGYPLPFTSSGADNGFVSFLAMEIGTALGFVCVEALLIWYRPARHALFNLMKLQRKCTGNINRNYDREYGLFREQANRIDTRPREQ